MPVITTLSFAGRTEEALDFYHEHLGAEILFLMRFSECPDSSLAKPGTEDLIFHATFRIEGTELMASDVGHDDPAFATGFSGFALALRPRSADRAQRIFEALADGGEIEVRLAESEFTGLYGIVIDRFGVWWKINVDRESVQGA